VRLLSHGLFARAVHGAGLQRPRLGFAALAQVAADDVVHALQLGQHVKVRLVENREGLLAAVLARTTRRARDDLAVLVPQQDAR
jgi:hypothetical protein